jgi:hypothetical protein
VRSGRVHEHGQNWVSSPRIAIGRASLDLFFQMTLAFLVVVPLLCASKTVILPLSQISIHFDLYI